MHAPSLSKNSCAPCFGFYGVQRVSNCTNMFQIGSFDHKERSDGNVNETREIYTKRLEEMKSPEVWHHLPAVHVALNPLPAMFWSDWNMTRRKLVVESGTLGRPEGRVPLYTPTSGADSWAPSYTVTVSYSASRSKLTNWNINRVIIDQFSQSLFFEDLISWY